MNKGESLKSISKIHNGKLLNLKYAEVNPEENESFLISSDEQGKVCLIKFYKTYFSYNTEHVELLN